MKGKWDKNDIEEYKLNLQSTILLVIEPSQCDNNNFKSITYIIKSLYLNQYLSIINSLYLNQ